MRQVVGIDRKIKRAWVDALLDRLVQTTDGAELRAFVDQNLQEELRGKESRSKSAGIVLRIWSGIPLERVSLRDRALALLPRISGQDRLWLHWGMAALAYPFFRDTAEVVGRLLSLQDDFTTAHVQARMLTTWGDRVTTRDAAKKLLNTLVDWEVLRRGKGKGQFLLSRRFNACIPELQLWLLEALLSASTADEIEAQQLLRLPESFPFTLTVGVADLRRSERFNIHRQGLDMDMVALRQVRVAPPPKPAAKPKKSKKKPGNPLQPGLFDWDAAADERRSGQPQPQPRAATTAKVKSSSSTRATRPRMKTSGRSEVPRPPVEQAKQLVDDRAPEFAARHLFSTAALECAALYHAGHYLGCIALSETVLEAIIRHLWQVNCKKKPDQEGSFSKNLAALHKKQLISDEWRGKLDPTTRGRQALRHLSPSGRSDHTQLEQTARKALTLVHELEREYFVLTPAGGMVVPEK